MIRSYRRLKYACFTVNVAMSVVGNLSPLLFITFHTMYGISYTLLGLLVLINFFTQLIIDLILSFFSHKFNVPKTVKMIPLMTFAGLAVYAQWPLLMPDSVYAGLVVGTVIFSASGGFSEVLISPVIAAIPAKDPDREMSKLHSVYAWGVVLVIVVGTLFLLLCGTESWPYLVLLFALIPLAAAVLFAGTEFPPLDTDQRVVGHGGLFREKALWLFVIGIFLGGAAECTMAQWISGYLEGALGIPKIWGDIFGVAVFSVMLGLGRTLYAKMGKTIYPVLFFGAAGATACYLVAAFSSNPIVGLAACALTGLCVSMLWPGSLISVSDRFPSCGVVVFALMAAGGDLGASVGPQLVGVITDTIAAGGTAAEWAARLGLTPDQLGMKCGILVGAIFSALGMIVYTVQWRNKRRALLTKAPKCDTIDH